MIEVMGMHGMVFVFAGISIVGIICVYLFIPETKGKTIEEILESL